MNVGKSKVMRCAREGGRDRLDVGLDGEMLEEVESFKYLGSHVAINVRVDVEVGHRVKKASKCMGGMKSVLRIRGLGMNAKRKFYEGVVVPTALYGSDTLNVRKSERNRLDVFEMRCLRSMVGVTRMERVRNEEVSSRAGIVRKMSETVDHKVSSWYGHVVRMAEESLTKRV